MGIFSEVGELIAKEASPGTQYETKPEQQHDFSSEDMMPPPIEGEVISDGEDTLQVVVINRIVPSKKTSETHKNNIPESNVTKDENDLSFWNMPPKIFEMPPEIKNAKRIIPQEKVAEAPAEPVKETEPVVEDVQETPKSTAKEPEAKTVSSVKEDVVKEKTTASKKASSAKTTPGSIEGDIHFPSNATVTANIHGDVKADGELVFHGNIVGNVEAETLTLCGVIEGSLKCKSLTLLPISNSQMSCIKGSVSTEALYTAFTSE